MRNGLDTAAETPGGTTARGKSESAFSACTPMKTAFHEQHPWLFRWPPLLFTIFWVTDKLRWGPQGHWASFALFYAVFLLAFIRVFWENERHPKFWLAVLFVIGYVYVPFAVNAAGEFVFPVVMSVFFLRQPKLSVALRQFALLEVLAAAGCYTELKLIGAHPAVAQNVIFYMFAIGLSNFAYARHMLASEQLERANQEIEHLAQVAERERIARDLHDLLGHTLTVITLKSDVANRLFTLDPERAHREIAEIEITARKALAEVREAVSGYRAEGLSSEVFAARRTLASAGVQLTTDLESVALADKETGVLCLVLREAVTNVIRHADATACRLELRRDGHHLRFALEDNGNGGTGPEGNGLRGMRERLATCGGTLLREAVPGGGTRIVAALPLPQSSPGTQTAAAGNGTAASPFLVPAESGLVPAESGLVQA